MGWPWNWLQFDSSTGRYVVTMESPFLVKWCAVQKLRYADSTSELVGTDVIGDPDFLVSPLAGGYIFEYKILGPQSEPFNTDTTPPATVAEITLKWGNNTAGHHTLEPGESFEYRNPLDNSFISVAFVGGHATDDRCGFKCRTCADFTVRIRSEDTTEPRKFPVICLPSFHRKSSPLQSEDECASTFLCRHMKGGRIAGRLSGVTGDAACTSR